MCEDMSRDQPVPDRSCGTCTACCTEVAVESVGKPHQCRCEHQTYTGCGIYDARPSQCRVFYCLWRMGFGTGDDRPDRSGVLLYLDAGTPITGLPYALTVVEVTPGAVGRRFQNLENLLALLPDRSLWEVRFYPHGVPRGYDGPVAPAYQDVAPPEVVTSLVGTISDPAGRWKNFVIHEGFTDSLGHFHGSTRWPGWLASLVGEDRAADQTTN
jgi:hypothetical protein